ncbi:hypothetical protein DL93DRAFT_1163913 [Clavulina sp. PMI_390]|nr:hypothetical protein DL93DRAFT_1163913 [Clavulina sp. PMI_390]
MGCERAKPSPPLSFRVGGKGVLQILESEEDWEQACIAGISKGLTIVVDKNWAKGFLEANQKKQAKASQLASKTSRKKKPSAAFTVEILSDSDAEAESEVDAADLVSKSRTGGASRTYEQCWDELDTAWRSCRACGDGKRCKLGSNLQHLQPTASEMGIWATAMMKDPGITPHIVPDVIGLHRFQERGRPRVKSERPSPSRQSYSRSRSGSWSSSRSRSRSRSHSRSSRHHRSQHYHGRHHRSRHSRSRSPRRHSHSSYSPKPSQNGRYLAINNTELLLPTLGEYVEDFNDRYQDTVHHIDEQIFVDEGITTFLELANLNASEFRSVFSIRFGTARTLEDDVQQTLKKLKDDYREIQKRKH